MNKRWEILPVDEKKQQELVKALQISPTLAEILARRNLSVEESKLFLHPENIPYDDPFLLKDMQKACDRIKKSLERHEKICVYGDYDVDGVTSTALLLKVFSELGIKADYYLPDRHSEGYGLHVESLDKLILEYDLLITVDCGITALEEVDYAKDKIDIIITDHHLPREKQPDALAVVNPNQEGCTYPNKNLCGVGVAFKLCQALYKSLHKDVAQLEKYLDIVALGTIADIVPLVGENRRIVKKGLADINNVGIRELLNICGCDIDKVNTGHIGFGIAPRLNAAGRLTHASTAVKLLLAADSNIAKERGLYLDAENKKRQEIVEDIFREAVLKIEESNGRKKRVIVVVGEGWNEGVIGIAASRLQERYYRPIIIIATDDKTNLGKASCRSIDGFHMKNALTACEQDFVVYGGHSKAAGFTIEITKIPDFIEHIKVYAKENLADDDLIPVFNVEAVIEPQDITEDFIEELALLEPFGMGNAKPQFCCQHLYVDQTKIMGKEQNHLRCVFEKASDKVNDVSARYTAVGWNMAVWAEKIAYKNIDILFQPDLNHWNGKTYIQFKLTDLRLEDASSMPTYLEKYPAYEAIGKLYLSLRKLSVQQHTAKLPLSLIKDNLYHLYGIELSDYALQQSLKILSEIDILSFVDNKADTILLKPAPKTKMDIKTSPTFAQRFNLQRL